MNEADSIVREFVAETHENLGQLELDLVALEQDPTSRDLVSSIFRTVHTVKGTCGFLGFSRLETLAHAGENLLSRWRDGEITTGSDSIDLLLRVVDVLRRLLASIDATGSDDVEVEAVAAVVGDIDRYLSATAAPTDSTDGAGNTGSATSTDSAGSSDSASAPSAPTAQQPPRATWTSPGCRGRQRRRSGSASTCSTHSSVRSGSWSCRATGWAGWPASTSTRSWSRSHRRSAESSTSSRPRS